MRTAVTQTSIEAYHETQDVRKTQRDALLRQIKLDGRDGSCIADLAYITGLEKSSVAGRLNELRKLGFLVFVGKKPSKTTGINSEFYRVKQFSEMLF